MEEMKWSSSGLLGVLAANSLGFLFIFIFVCVASLVLAKFARVIHNLIGLMVFYM
jgi:hypothetical protein